MRNRHAWLVEDIWFYDIVGLCIRCSKRNGWYATFLAPASPVRRLRLWSNAVHVVYWRVGGPSVQTLLGWWKFEGDIPWCLIGATMGDLFVIQMCFSCVQNFTDQHDVWWLSQGAKIWTLSPCRCWGMIYAGESSDLFGLRWCVNQSETPSPDQQQAYIQ